MIITGNENEFRRLLADNTNLNATDENGNTAIILAAKRGKNNLLLGSKNWFMSNI